VPIRAPGDVIDQPAWVVNDLAAHATDGIPHPHGARPS
jgi:hypothetical protein